MERGWIIVKYKKLINFERIESVVQIKNADKKDEAERLIKTYIISEEMSSKIENIIIPQLQFENPCDNKGLLIVGNYGTGKSHLMSVISSVTEDLTLNEFVRNDKTKIALEQIAGRFEVIRLEIGAIDAQLKEIIFHALEEKMETFDIDYSFEEMKNKPNNKYAFEDLMMHFNDKFPNKGLLLIVDELLDFLRTKKEQELIKDLNFLREIGEVCKDSRFRFIAGIQEAIFDNPRFSFVSAQLRRVKARFEQVPIDRKDIKFVVANRLLNKTQGQKALIREHLEKFSSFYDGMNEKMDDYVNLFPIHPNYIDTFEGIAAIEKRQVLKTLSQVMTERLEQELDPDFPGIISFDNFYDDLKANPAYRSISDIKSVIDCSEILQDLVNTNYSKRKDKSLAIRIIKGLSIHRLTVGSLSSQNGLTAEALRDKLCLYNPLIAELGGEDPSEDLKGEIETALRLISQTVSGQFISATEVSKSGQLSGQFYLDITKNVDYDEKIRTKAEGLDDNILDRYYFEVLKIVMECQDDTYLTGYKIWEHELIWTDKNVSRSGYLFFGAPNERSTATPPRDFYIYFSQLKTGPKYKDELLEDEIFFKLSSPDNEFNNLLKGYAAAYELVNISSGESKNIYSKKGKASQKKLIKWLQNNMLKAFQVTFQGKKTKLSSAISANNIGGQRNLYTKETQNFRDIINNLASHHFSTTFKNIAPKYPKFDILLTTQNRNNAIKETLQNIAGQKKSKVSNAVLEALHLLDDGEINTENSLYATFILDLLPKKGTHQVLNREKIFNETAVGVEYMDPKNARLEPELSLIVIAALIYSGEIVLTAQGTKYDATKLKLLATEKIQDLINFKHLQRPKDWDIKALRTLFKLLELNPNEVDLIKDRKDTPVQNLQQAIKLWVEKIIDMKIKIEEGLSFWEIDSFNELQIESSIVTNQLHQTKTFLEGIAVYNTPGKLKNLQIPIETIESHSETIKIIKKIEKLKTFVIETIQETNWMSTVRALIFTNQDAAPSKELKDWQNEVIKVKSDILSKLKNEFSKDIPFLKPLSTEVKNSLSQLKDKYIQQYLKLHEQARLGINEERRKERILSSSTLNRLDTLISVDLIPEQQLTEFKNELAGLKVCYNLSKQQLEDRPICSHCNFNPSTETFNSNGLTIDNFENDLDAITDNWTKLLLSNLNDPIIKMNITLLQENEKEMINQFMDKRELPEEHLEEFVTTMNTIFSGLQKVNIKRSDWIEILENAGPMTPEKLKQFVNNYIDALVNGKDTKKIRITLS
jgi:hypothetical protein